MYAIIQSGGKQYKAEPEGTIITDKIEGNPGDVIEINDVLVIGKDKGLEVGIPFVKGAMVKAKIVRQTLGKKIEGFNYKPKKNERKRWGHRQPETHLQIVEIVGSK